jgi:hypothetical protein
MRTLVCVLALAPIVPGCLGGFVGYTRTIELHSPTITDGILRSADGEPTLTADQARKSLGPPDKVEEGSSGEERWIYAGHTNRWSGVLLFLVVVPLPLCIPVGKERLTVIVRRDVAVDAIVALDDESFAYLGLEVEDCGPGSFGFHAGPDVHVDQRVRQTGLPVPFR